MVRVVVLYDEAPDPQRYEQHLALCRSVPGATFRHGPVFGAPVGEPQHAVLRRVRVAGPGLVQGGRVVRRVRGDRAGRDGDGAGGSASSSRGSSALGKPRLALLAHGRNAFVHVGPRQVEELERERRVEGRPGGAQPVVERELRVADRRLGAFGEPRRDFERAPSSSSSATQSETSPIRSASMPSSGSQRSRWYFAFARPQSSGQTIAAWSPAATPSFVWPSTIRAPGSRSRCPPAARRPGLRRRPGR